MLHNIATAAGLFLLLFGMFVFLTSVFGIFRLRYVLNRMHVAALCDALGIFSVLAGLILLRGWSVISLKLALILVFLWMTSPVASHLIAEMELLTHAHMEKECEVEKR
ncbi:MAG: monovalent cation/H(+) antiporter subunit G [Oscillospiraceae bacterium]